METSSALLAICAGNWPVTGEFPTQRPVTRSFDIFFDLRLNKPLSKQSWSWWFGTPSCPVWRHCNAKKSWYRWVILHVVSLVIIYCWTNSIIAGMTLMYAPADTWTSTLILKQNARGVYDSHINLRGKSCRIGISKNPHAELIVLECLAWKLPDC